MCEGVCACARQAAACAQRQAACVAGRVRVAGSARGVGRQRGEMRVRVCVVYRRACQACVVAMFEVCVCGGSGRHA